MNYRDHFLQLLDYDRWAMEHLLTSLREASLENSPEQDMFNHVALAQIVWMERVNGRTPARSAFDKPQLTLDGSGELAAQGHKAMEDVISNAKPEDFLRVLPYKDSRGNAYQNEIRDILMHVFNHGTHHRGQINMMLRQRGLTPRWIDYIILKR